jgi:hypothetical protein
MVTGDTIIHEYKGEVYSDRMNTQGVTKRFKSSTQRLRMVHIRNNGDTYSALIGKYYSSWFTFTDAAYTLKPGYTLWLEYVDLYYLGYFQFGGGYTALEVLGTY